MRALIIFVRNFIPGKVKTRIAAVIGEQKAVDIYRQLLQHTLQVTQEVACTKYVYYSDFIPEIDIWDPGHFVKRLQNGNDLGERMHHAIAEVLLNHSHVVLIGSDIVDLDEETLIRSLDALKYVDVVVGPARDGGYYLIGMKNNNTELFDRISWSTPDVLRQTTAKLISQAYAFKLLSRKTDIDTVSDLSHADWIV